MSGGQAQVPSHSLGKRVRGGWEWGLGGGQAHPVTPKGLSLDSGFS